MSFTYKGLKAVKKIHVVTPEEVEKEMQHLVESRPRITVITDRPAQEGDELLLDYAGFCGQEQFQGGTAEKQTLTLGSHTFIPGFEEQLVGARAGSEVTVNVKFPDQYHSDALAGKDARFCCKIHEIRQHSAYSLDDTFAKEVGGCDTLEQMREKMGRSMQYYQDEQAEIALQDSLLAQAAMTLPMEVTQEQIDKAIDEQLEAVEAQLSRQGANLELYCQVMGTTVEKIRKDAEPSARKNILSAAAIDEIARLENVQVEEKELEEAREQVCRSNGITMEQLKAMNDPHVEEMVHRAVLASKVLGLIRSFAEVSEEKES